MNIKHGKIENIIDDHLLHNLKIVFEKSSIQETPHSKLYPVGQTHKDFALLNKVFLPILKKHFDNDIKIGVCTYTQAHGSFGLHFDNYQVDALGDPYLSILFPIGEVQEFTTYIFDLESHESEKSKDVNDMLEARSVKNKINDPKLSHIKQKHLSKLEILGQYNWTKNSAIYWQNNLLHSSCRHPEHIPYKEFIVIHSFL